MIKTIQLEKYKRFERFSISARKGNILVGPNNSGKSTILDALRMVDAGLRQLKRNPQYIAHNAGGFRGYIIPDSALPFTADNTVRNYGDDDAKITITHKNGSKAIFLVHPDRTTRFYVQTKEGQPRTAVAYRKAFPLNLLIVPTLGPLEIDEKVRKVDTIKSNINTRIAARNFRNIWKFLPPADFDEFSKRISYVWPGITLDRPEVVNATPPYLTMFFREGRIPREIQWAGYGFQIWLQLQTHLARAKENSILVLDEPDIYLHPELQHNLYHDVSRSFPQFFIATHATEIINESPAQDLIVVDPTSKKGMRIANDEQYVSMLNYIGSAQNADFARISRAKRVIFVEGSDARLLRSFARKFGRSKVASSNRTPIQELGGFTQSGRAKATVWAFKKLLNVDVATLCLFDRDYRSEAELDAFISDMQGEQQRCHVLSRKEIENYLLDPVAISAAVNTKLIKAGREESCTTQACKKLLWKIFTEYEVQCQSQYLGSYIKYHSVVDRGIDVSTHIQSATQIFDSNWQTFEGRQSMVPGKDVFKGIVNALRDEFGVSVTANMVISELSESDDNDLLDFLNEAEAFMA